MKNKNIYFRKYTLISAAAITVALILLLLETYMQNDRARTLHRAMQTVDGEPLVFSKYMDNPQDALINFADVK